MIPVHLKSFLGYGLAALMQGLVAFLTVPMLIQVLGVKNFALWAIFEPAVASLTQLALLGACYGYIRLLAMKLQKPLNLYKAQFRQGWIPMILVSVVGGAGLVMYVGLSDTLATIALACIFVLLEAVLLLAQSILRGDSNATGYAIVVWVRYGLLGLLVFCLAFNKVQLTGGEYITLLIMVDVLALSAACSLARFSPLVRAGELTHAGSSKNIYWDSVKYGMPIVIASILAMIVSNGDRYVVHAMLSHEQLAGYVTMAKLAGAMAFASAPVNLWWPSARFKHASDPDQGAAFYSAATGALLAYYAVIAVLSYLLAPLVIRWYGQGVVGYDGTSMAILLAAAVATAMVTPMNVGTLNEGKTHWSIYAVGSSAILGLISAIFLIPALGYVGAALAALVAQGASLALTHLISQKIQPLAFNYKKPILLLCLFGLLLSGMSHLPSSGIGPWLAFLCFACFAVYMSTAEIMKVLKA
jgi:O-antigen/teichoic acid export membrane protein